MSNNKIPEMPEWQKRIHKAEEERNLAFAAEVSKLTVKLAGEGFRTIGMRQRIKDVTPETKLLESKDE